MTISLSIDSWHGETLARLVDYVSQALHPEQSQTLHALMHAVVDARQTCDSSSLADCERLLSALSDELHDHQDKEERLLFPLIRRAEVWSSASTITVMLREHEGLLKEVDQARAALQLLPATPEISLVRQRFLAFEELFRFHLQLEDAVLFQRALLEEASSATPLRKAGGL